MKKIGYLILLAGLISCNTEEVDNKTDHNPPAPIHEIMPIANDTLKNLTEPKDTSHLVLLGRGSEPGWICEFYANRIRFVYNYGSDSIIIRGLNFTYQMQNATYFNDLKVESRNKDTSFATQPGPCKEESTGEMKPLKMIIKMGKKEFNGCAWVTF